MERLAGLVKSWNPENPDSDKNERLQFLLNISFTNPEFHPPLPKERG